MTFSSRITVLFFSIGSLMAFPQYLARFTADPLSSPNFKGRCATCHIDPKGGSPRNEFGQAFEANNFTITPDLRARFPERFQYPIQVVDAHTEVHFADPSNKAVVLKSDGKVTLIDPSAPPTGGAPQPVAAAHTAQAAPSGAVSDWEKPMQDSNRWINLPQPMPVHFKDMNFLVQHRFSRPLFHASMKDLFGLDSTANIAFGFDYGIWNHLMLSVYRARTERTLEMSLTADLLHQKHEDPISLAARVGIEGQNNFQTFFSPHVQLMAERRFGRYVTALASPSIVFNSQNNQLFFFRDIATNPDKDYTLNLGLGLALQFRPSLALVGEYVPRLSGFRGYTTDRPAVSVALQKQTFHHVFSLVISTSNELSPARYGPNVGPDTDNRFKIGFNIFRKLR
ncbi:MAG TPA: DUF5777 family beta-barrel protein [Acidobacteriota bacterium]|jgi:hypothetical protein